MNKILLLFVVVLLASCSSSKWATSRGEVEKNYLNFESTIEGKEPGVQFDHSSGDPTVSPSMLIRGINSLNANTYPLIILDGMPYDGPLNMINPHDIESVKVLKNASETAIYGMRGANGVVVITTKKGKRH
ncbi:MAG: TonB-dependent receptor plug domain-containing protein [Muribaculaceae bacterium]|nr:TonB-dependent receptor plug domain-containing protein [Muribaculaceae bacterium]MBR5117064.1 TonB-dependent receptor plug domain-containing protein [Muribaculaceae bacterium]